MCFKIQIYQDDCNESEILNVIDRMNQCKLDKFLFSLSRLEQEGTWLGRPLVAWLSKGSVKLWELRIDQDRYSFFIHNGEIVLLTHFEKKSSKTPQKEINRAKSKAHDWMNRN